MKAKLLAAILLFMSLFSYSQERWQADLHISSTKGFCNGKDSVTLKVEVRNYNDDDTRNVKMLITLPVEVKVLSLPANCQLLRKSIPAGTVFTGCVECLIGNMAVNQTNTIILSTSLSAYGNRFGVFVWGETPDPLPSNNFKEILVTCK